MILRMIQRTVRLYSTIFDKDNSLRPFVWWGLNANGCQTFPELGAKQMRPCGFGRLAENKRTNSGLHERGHVTH